MERVRGREGGMERGRGREKKRELEGERERCKVRKEGGSEVA
jgi:hypothetical protein